MPAKYRVTHNGEPLAFGKVHFTSSSTNTPLDTYSTPGLTVANTNPVILDQNGEADVYLQSLSYNEAVYDSNGALIRTRNGISGDILSSSQADELYVKRGSASSIAVVTRDVISNVRTYTGTLTGVSSYTNGLMIGIIPDVVSGSETAFYVNINGLGDRRIYSAIGGLPALVAGTQVQLTFNGTNFIVSSSAALLSNQSVLDVVQVGTTEQTKLRASVATGIAEVAATYTGGDSRLNLLGSELNLSVSSEERATINEEPIATRSWVGSNYDSKNAGILFKTQGVNLGTPGTVNSINFAGILKATRSTNAIEVSVDFDTPTAIVVPVCRAYKSGSVQAISTSPTVITFISDIDNSGMFVSSESKFIPDIPGYYNVSWSVQVTDSPAAIFAGVYKNGNYYAGGSFAGTNSSAPFQISSGSCLVYLNGTTDYVQIKAYYTSGTNVAVQDGPGTQVFVSLASAA